LEQEKANQLAKIDRVNLISQAKEGISVKGSLEQRALALSRLQKTYSLLTLEERNSPFGQRLAKTIPQLNAQVLTLEQTLGKSQRNVGNYGNAFTKAFGLVRTAAQILPGIGIAGIFGLALDPIIELINKLDLFKIKVSQARENLNAFNEVNKNASKQYGEEATVLKILYNAATDVTLSTEKRTKAAKELIKIYPETFKNSEINAILTGKEADKYELLTKQILASARAQAVKNKLTEIEAQRTELAFTREKVNNATQNEIASQSSDVIKRINDQNKQYTDAQAKFRTTQAQASKNINDNIVKPAIERNKAAQKDLNEKDKILAAQAKFLIKYAGQENLVDAVINNDDKVKNYGSGRSGADREKDARDSAAALVQIEIDANQQIADVYRKQSENINFSLETRLDAQKNYSDTVLNIADLEAKKEIVGKKNTADELLAIESKREKKRIDIAAQTSDDIIKITKESLAEIDRIRALQFQRDLTNLDRIRDEELTKLNERYAAGKLSLEDYEKEKLDLTRKANRIAIQEQIDQVQKLIDIDSARQLDVTDNLAKLAALRLRYSETEIDLTKKTADEKKAVYDKEKELLQDVFNFGRQLAANLFQSQIDDIDKQKEAAEERKNVEIENVNESVASEQDKKDRIAVIEANAANEQEQLTAKQNEIKRKQAIADKAAAIAQAIINIALAQTKNVATLGFLGLPLNAVIAAIGAVQIASIIAQPIPKFAKGKNAGNNYEGLAYVGDGGMNELVINKDGSSWVTPNTPTLTYVGRDTEVISGPAFQQMQIMAKPEYSVATGGKSWDVSPIVASNERTAKRIERAVSKMKVSATHITKGGFVKESTTISAFNKRMNRKFGW